MTWRTIREAAMVGTRPVPGGIRLAALVSACVVTWLTLALVLPGSAAGAGPRRASGPAAVRPGGALDAYVRQLSMHHEFSGVIAVARGNRIILQRAYGLADAARGLPNRVDTKFNLGSACKMFTAVAIAQLVEKRKLRFTEATTVT